MRGSVFPRRPRWSSAASRGACYDPLVDGRRWIIANVGDSTFERLATELSGSELQSVLLEVMQRRAGARKPADVLAQYRRDPFCKPAAIDLRTSVAVDAHLLA